jgi:hypothetical protein
MAQIKILKPRICPICKIEFTPKSKRTTHCSARCGGFSAKGLDAVPIKNKYTCIWCSALTHNKKYCSRKCMAESFRFKLIGIANPAWKGKQKSNPYFWKSWRPVREIILKRDNYKCQLCGKKKKRLVVHHIFEVPENGDISVPSKDYLITLCTSCHITIHLNKEFNYILKEFKNAIQSKNLSMLQQTN